jgi:hypothetical protein
MSRNVKKSSARVLSMVSGGAAKPQQEVASMPDTRQGTVARMPATRQGTVARTQAAPNK